MKRFIYALGAAVLAVSACDVTYPVAVVGPANTVYRGTATATFVEGGWFQVSNGGNTCTGRYLPASQAKQITFPVKCSNGLTGIGSAVYETPRSGGGQIVMQDGTNWQFIFGNGAIGV